MMRPRVERRVIFTVLYYVGAVPPGQMPYRVEQQEVSAVRLWPPCQLHKARAER